MRPDRDMRPRVVVGLPHLATNAAKDAAAQGPDLKAFGIDRPR